MKPFRMFLIAVLVATFGAWSCESDDDDNDGCCGDTDSDGDTDGDADTDTDTGTDSDQLECDVVLQDCEAAGEKCSVVSLGAGNGRANDCVVIEGDGDKALGEECARSDFGHDDCVAGLLCTWTGGLSTDPLTCHALCVESADCEAPENCLNVGMGPLSRAGICLPPCEPWGTDCLDGQACRLVVDPLATSLDPFCLEHEGAVPNGSACDVTPACADPTAFCDGLQPPWEIYSPSAPGTCVPTCDDAHPCEADAGVECTPLDNAPDDIGLCG